MTDPERDHLIQENADLRRSRGRWRLACLVLLGLLALPVALGGLVGVVWVPRLQQERLAREEERARRKEVEGYFQAIAAKQAERARAMEEQARAMEERARAAQGRAAAGKGEGKD